MSYKVLSFSFNYSSPVWPVATLVTDIKRGKVQTTLPQPSLLLLLLALLLIVGSVSRVSVFTLRMNFHFTPNLVKGYRCFFCRRVFDSPQAVGGHLRAHQEEIKARKSWIPGQLSYSEIITSNDQSLSISHSENFSEGVGSSSPCLISNGVCQFNTDGVQNVMDGMSSLSENPLPFIPHKYFGKLPSLEDAVPDVDRGLSSNQLPGFKELILLDSLAHNPSQSSGHGEVGNSQKNNGGKRRFCGEAHGNAGTENELKRTKINSDDMELDGPRKIELNLFTEQDNSNFGSGMPFDLDEGETNLDLSLHL